MRGMLNAQSEHSLERAAHYGSESKRPSIVHTTEKHSRKSLFSQKSAVRSIKIDDPKDHIDDETYAIFVDNEAPDSSRKSKVLMSKLDEL